MKKLENVNKVIIHCSATPSDLDFTVEDIRKWHLERGWDDVGYHFVIRKDGAVEAGRDIEYQGAHTLGHNGNSIAICLIGGQDGTGNYTWKQWRSLEGLVERLRRKYGWLPCYGHNDFTDQKTCPNFNVQEWDLQFPPF